MKTNLLTKRGLPTLLKEIKHQVQQLPHIGSELPKAWVDIRRQLEERAKDENYIDYKEYRDVCKAHEIPEKERADFLSDYLHVVQLLSSN